MFIAESASEKCFKSVNIWHSYGQKGGLSSSFSSVVAQTHKVHETTTFLLQTLPVKKNGEYLADSAINLS